MSAAIVAFVAIHGAVVAQSPCDSRALPDGPLVIGFEQADFGVARRACPRTEVAVGGGGRAIIEEASFYADLRGAARADVSFQPFDQLELALSLEPIFYEQVIQSFRASHLGFGDTSVSGTLLAFARESFALSVMARATLPTAFGYYQNASPVGFDAGLLSTLEPVDGIRLHGGALALGSFAITKAAPDERGGLAMNLGADLVPFEWLAIVVDTHTQVLERDPLDRVAVGGGVRASLWDVGCELGVMVPIAGADRHMAAVQLKLAYRFW
jgi:hypothetical protein